MNHIKLKTSLVAIGLSCVVHTYGQTSETDNVASSPTSFLGWNGSGISPSMDLNIRHDANRSIRFSTNTIGRMLINNGSNGPNDGQILMAEATSSLLPTSRLHLHQRSADNLLRFTNSWTPMTSGFDVGLLDNSSTNPNARIRLHANGFLALEQNSLERMRIQQQDTWTGLDGIPISNVSRITLGHTGETNLAWSMLHLWQGTLPGAMQRAWYDKGVSITGNTDFMYSGLLESGNGNGLATDAVIAWGCQDLNSFNGNVDNFRFIFLKGESATPNEASRTQQGLETMRITPRGNVGIGNFSNQTWTGGAGLAQQPTHRLDVDGNQRNRLMLPANTPNVIVVGEQVDAVGDYQLDYLTFSGDGTEYLGGDGTWHDASGGGSDCDWENVPNGIQSGNSSDCNDRNIGMGTAPLTNTKAAVSSGNLSGDLNSVSAFSAIASISGIPSSAFQRVGVAGTARGGNPAYGGLFNASGNGNGTGYSVGAFGYGTSAEYAFGLYGKARGCKNSYGVYGEGIVSSCSSSTWGGYFVGGVTTTGPSIAISDRSVKEDVKDIQDALSIIEALAPKTYYFKDDKQERLGLNDRLHHGFIAQEVQKVAPALVQETTVPPRYDEEGKMVDAEVPLLGMNYIEVIPILTKGIKEQQAEINVLNDRLAQLESDLQRLATDPIAASAAQSDYDLYQNRPNPFSISTEIVWRMAEDSKARIVVKDVNGVAVATLYDGLCTKGLHSLEWNAGNLASGTYFYSLEVGGEMLIKRAIKLTR